MERWGSQPRWQREPVWRVYTDWPGSDRATPLSMNRILFWGFTQPSFLMFAPDDSTWATYTDLPL